METGSNYHASEMTQSIYSDEVFNTFCSPCQKRNRQTTADLFCQNCKDYYCSNCVTFHQEFPALWSHIIIEKSKLDLMVGSEIPSEHCTRHNKLVDMYCTSHKKVGCYICLSSEHQACKRLYVPESVAEIRKICDIRGFKEDCNAVRQAANGRIKEFEENLTKFKDEKDTVLKKVKSFKNDLVVWLDEIERKTIENLEVVYAIYESKWTKVITDFKKCIEDTEQYVTKVNLAAQNISQQFICTFLGMEIVTSAMKQINEDFSELKSTIEFNPCFELKALKESKIILGTFTETPMDYDCFNASKAKDNLTMDVKEQAKVMLIGRRVVSLELEDCS